MEPFGRRDHRDGVDGLVVELQLDHAPERVWHALTTPEGLEPWIGTYDGDPEAGRVAFRMTAESPDAAPEQVEIRRCEPNRALDVRIAMGEEGWELELVLEPIGEATRLSLRQLVRDPVGIDLVGPGWEYSLHALREHLDGRDPKALDFFGDYLPNAAFYAELFDVDPSSPPQADGAAEDSTA